jgi:pimeloyl-ACP methyl ester carboxylesterase
MNGNDKPILLYLPGFDGTYICPFIQFPELGTEFEVWCMTVGMEDRSTYRELKTIVLDFLRNNLAIDDEMKPSSSSRTVGDKDDAEEMGEKQNSDSDNSGRFAGFFGGNAKKIGQKKGGRPIYIAGESFGGILASDVALTLLMEQKKRKDVDDAFVDLRGLVLINPATCYDRSQLATAGPPVAKTPFPFYLFGLFSKLVPLFTDEHSLEQLFLILQAKALPSVIDNACREAYMGRVALSLPTKLEFMPPTTLSWRLNEWLQTGCAALRDSSFAAFPNFRSLIVVGEKDKTLPSIAEAERLANKVMNPTRTKIHVVNGAGHASTCGSRLDLTAVIRDGFPELQKTRAGVRWRKGKRTQQSNIEIDGGTDIASRESLLVKRTRMKPEAQQGYGPNYGMEERYDKADIGLNPLLYWSKSNYKSVRRVIQERHITVPKTQDRIHYRKSVYAVSD